METKLEIRSAKLCDIEELWNFITIVFSVHENEFKPSVLDKGKEDLLEKRNSWLVGLVRCEIVAAANHEVEKDIYTFSYLSVRPDMRRLGYGTQLYRYIEACAQSRGRQTILVAVRRAIDSNIKFIESIGFHVVGVLDSSEKHDIYRNEVGSVA